jgi:RNA polymerase subunit RPABC4/transcription elongation factor Spt4
MPIKCERCGALNRDNVSTCIECGAPLPTAVHAPVIQQKACINCQKIINANLAVCPYCGANQAVIAPPFAPVVGTHNKLVAGLLAIFLGSFGVHKFYLSQSVQGIIYLLFCWTGIPAVVGIIEGIMYLSMTDQAFYQKYG